VISSADFQVFRHGKCIFYHTELYTETYVAICKAGVAQSMVGKSLVSTSAGTSINEVAIDTAVKITTYFTYDHFGNIWD
jgi:hypothetical protein